MKRIYLYPIIFAMTLLASCESFLDVRPDNVDSVNPKTVADFEEMLNAAALLQSDFLVADIMTDDFIISDASFNYGKATFYARTYLFSPEIWSAAEEDPIYAQSYKWILQMNIILESMEAATGGTPERKEIAIAQAKINRAYYYLQMANMYGKDYQSATAASDLAVPLITKPDPALKPTRATVKEVYDQIVLDLTDAINTENLPNFGVDIIHPGKAAAYAMLARTYLFMSDYDNALKAADEALKIKNTVMDMNSYSFVNAASPGLGINNKPNNLLSHAQNPEALLVRVCENIPYFKAFFGKPAASPELKTLFGSKDLRFIYNFYPTGATSISQYVSFTNSSGNSVMFFDYNIGVPEMMLTKAECLARKGEIQPAMNLLNELRKYRFKPEDLTQLSSTDKDDALKIVLEERRRELFFKGGVRLFDLKRLNRDERFKKDVIRTSNVTGEVLARLPANSPLYLFPFAKNIISNNPGIIQNPR